MADDDTPVEAYPFEFRALVVQQLEAHGLALKEWKDDGLDVEREDGQQQFIGLANLYRRVMAPLRQGWQPVIAKPEPVPDLPRESS